MILNKMKTQHEDVVQYSLPTDQGPLDLNSKIGKEIEIHFSGNIFCQNCGRKTRKSYSGGFCFPCSQTLAACDLCIVKPELCHFDEGTCREPEWGMSHCMQDHFVYLANSSGLKVGITRAGQIPTRWMDQGAVQAMRIFKTESRYLAGLVEVTLASFVADKTNWRAMLKEVSPDLDLVAKSRELLEAAGRNLNVLLKNYGEMAIEPFTEMDPFSFAYPVSIYPGKITALNLDKRNHIKSTLHGIKGQYLIMKEGVLNIRKHTGYDVEISFP